ncbi:HNH endonuclease signature motif containing protein [Mycolicibacterium chubuense]|nr:HNH endonuclease signature motif containing protein [Mycolicibacterium chubuense]
MFDIFPPEVADLGALNAGELVDAARGWARAENAACARKLAVMAEIFARRTSDSAEERELWWVDPEAAVAAELAAALQLTQGLALHQTHRGVALRDRLPKVAAVFEAGLISDLLVRKIVWRTWLITDPQLMAAVDAELAGQVSRWGALSEKKLEAAIDATVIAHDPAALRQPRPGTADRAVEFGSPTDEPGYTSLWARLYSPDAAAVCDRVNRVADSVCAADPRSHAERLCDAFGAIGAGLETLACRCGHDDCDAAGRETPTRNTTIYLIADAETTEEPTETVEPAADHEPATETVEQSETEPAKPAKRAKPAFAFGAGVMPPALLGALVEGARLRYVRHPGDSPAEERYTPSTALAEFIRCRDLTCRFPFCDKPATDADIDHTVPYPVGPTHASNLKCLCRFHHLVKTFWGGPDGWRDRQLPDGTVIWTSPTGHTYTTYPGSRLLFPSLCRPTATLWFGEPPTPQTRDGRTAMMPRRRRTRAANRSRAINAERKLNAEHSDRGSDPPF